MFERLIPLLIVIVSPDRLHSLSGKDSPGR